MKIRIGIVSHDRAEILPKAIESALSQDYADKELWVIDDASNDGTPELAARYPEVIWKRYESLKGYRHARNEMMRAPGADLFCSLDDDSWFLQGDELRIAANYLQEYPDTAAVAFDIIDPGSPEKRGRGCAEPAHTFIGCGHLLRLDAVAACGYYADTAGAYGVEEKDLSIQMLDRSFDIVRLSGVSVWHDKTMTARDVAQQHRSGVGNDLAFALRRCPAYHLAFVLPGKLLNHIGFALRFASIPSEKRDAFDKAIVMQIGKWGFCKPAVLGLIDFLLNLPAVVTHRNPVDPQAWQQYTTRSRQPTPWLPTNLPRSVAISIATRNRKDDLRTTLEVLGNLSPAPDELIIHCDRCTDGTEQMLAEEFPYARVLKDNTAPGSIPCRNQILREAQSDIILSLDDDSYPIETDSVTRILKIFSRDPRLAVVTFPQLTDEFHSSHTQIHPQQGAVANTGSFTNSGAAIRRDIYLRLDGYPIQFVHAYEEPDFALQCFAAGYMVLFKPDLSIRHLYSKQSRNEMRTHRYHARNEIWSALLRCPVPLLPLILPYRIWRQFRYACSRGFCWVLREPLWWADTLLGIPRILRRRSGTTLRSYWNWMRLLRNPEPLITDTPSCSDYAP